MDTDTTTEAGVDSSNNEGEGESNVETLTIPKKDYETMNQTLGSLKRELKDLKKAGEQSKETPTKETKTDEFGLLHKSYLRAAGITAEDEVELARTTAKKWGMELDTLVDDEDFQVKLEKLRTGKANAIATSNIRGSGGTGQASQTAEYWQAKGRPPTRADVPDRKTRVKIVRAMMKNASTDGKVFYND